MLFCCILDVSSGTCLQTTGKKEIFSQFFRVRNLFTSFHFGIQSKQLLLKPIIFTLHYDRMGWDGNGLCGLDKGNTIMDYTMLLNNMVITTSKNITPIWTSEIFWRFWYGIWYLILTVLLFFFEIWWNANHKQPHWIWIWILTSTKLLKIVKKDKIFLTLSLWTWNPIFPYQKAFLPLLNWTNINDGKHLKVTMFY